MTPEVTEERLVFFPCGEIHLAGVLSVPDQPNGRTVLIPWGAGTGPSSGRNRIRTRLARTLADRGFHAFRFDNRGVAESDGDYSKPDISAPNTEEIIAATAWLASQGLNRIAVVSICFGAWSSLMAAPLLVGLEGMAVVNSPVRRDHDQARASQRSWRWWAAKLRSVRLSKLRSAKRRALYRKLVAAKASSMMRSGSRDTRFSAAVLHLLDRHIPVLLVYGDDDFRVDLQSELDRGLLVALDKADPPTRLVIVAERLGGTASLGVQDLLLREVVSWLQELPALSP